MNRDSERSIRKILDEDAAWKQLADEFPDDIELIDRPQELPQLTASLSQMAHALGGLLVQKSDNESTIVNQQSADELEHTPESYSEIDEILHGIIAESDADAEAKRKIILLAHQNISLFEQALDEAKKKKISKSNAVLSRAERTIARSWDISELLANPILLASLHDTFCNYQSDNPVFKSLSEQLTSLLNKQLKYHFALEGTAISEDDMHGLFMLGEYSIINGATDTHYKKLFLESLIASLDSAKKASPSHVLDHYAKILLAISRTPDDNHQKELLTTLLGILNTDRFLYTTKAFFALAYQDNPNGFAIMQIEGELAGKHGVQIDIVSADTEYINSVVNYCSNHPHESDSIDFMATLREFVKENPNFSEALKIKKQFGEEISTVYDYFFAGLNTQISDLLESDNDDGLLEVFIDGNPMKALEAPVKEIVDRYSAQYPQLADYFTSFVNAETNEIMKKYRSYDAGRADVETSFKVANSALDAALSEDGVASIENLLQDLPEIYRNGFLIRAVPVTDYPEPIAIDELPQSIFIDAKDQINNRPAGSSPRAYITYKDYVLLMRPATENDKKRLGPVEKIQPLEGHILPEELQKSNNELRTALESIRQNILHESRIFVGRNGFVTHFEVNQIPTIVKMKRHADKSATISGLLQIGDIRVPFVFDSARKLYFDAQENISGVRLELAILLSSILHEFTCRPAVETEEGVTTDAEKLFLKRVAYLSYLPQGKKFSKRQSDLFLEIEGRDLATISNIRKAKDPFARNSTYVSAVEYEIAAGPIKLSFNPENIQL
jgi:hypothetical protein